MAEDPKRTPAPDSPEEMSRRQFFVKIGVGSVAVAALGTAAFAYQYLSPNVLYEPSPIVNAGKPDRYPPDSVTMDPQTAIYVVRTARRLLCAVGDLHAPGLPDRLQAGTRHHCLSLPRQQVQQGRHQDRRSGAEAAALAAHVAQR